MEFNNFHRAFMEPQFEKYYPSTDLDFWCDLGQTVSHRSVSVHCAQTRIIWTTSILGR